MIRRRYGPQEPEEGPEIVIRPREFDESVAVINPSILVQSGLYTHNSPPNRSEVSPEVSPEVQLALLETYLMRMRETLHHVEQTSLFQEADVRYVKRTMNNVLGDCINDVQESMSWIQSHIEERQATVAP